jgi:hypothetical protein
MTQYDDNVLQQQEAIRQSGMVNMFDKGGVKRIALDMGSTELVEFIETASGAEYLDMAEEAAVQFSP